MPQLQKPWQNESFDTIADHVVQVLSNGGFPQDLYGFSDKQIEAVYSLGNAAFKQGDYSKAAILYNFVSVCAPLEARYHKACGCAYHKQKDYAKAVHAYSQAAIMDYEDYTPSLYAAECLVNLKQYPRARAALEAVRMQVKDLPATTKENVQKIIRDLAQVIQSKTENTTKNKTKN